jgi:hypothetical protein
MAAQLYYSYLVYLKERLFMTANEAKKTSDKSRFDFCPQCGRKGLYSVHQQYYRCRYCGAYIISPTDKNDKKANPDPFWHSALSTKPILNDA